MADPVRRSGTTYLGPVTPEVERMFARMNRAARRGDRRLVKKANVGLLQALRRNVTESLRQGGEEARDRAALDALDRCLAPESPRRGCRR